MNRFDWHARYHQDALDGMLMLTLEERGAYNTLLDLIYSRGGPVPDDERFLAGWMGCSVKKWRIIRATLLVKGKLEPAEHLGQPALINARAAAELELSAARSRLAAHSGATGGRVSAQNRQKDKENKGNAQASLKLKTETRQLEANASVVDADDARRAPTYPDLFEQAWKAYPHVKGRSSKPKALGHWRRLPASERELLPAACAAYRAKGREPNAECGSPGMDRWLRDGRHADWLASPKTSPTATPEVIAWRLERYHETGEWRPEWGERPKGQAA